MLLPASFLALFAGTLVVKELRAQIAMPGGPHAQAPARLLAPEPGSLPDSWIAGLDCGGSEPEMQVHAYNDDLYIIRQSKCATYEAPFLYLIFGSDKVLLIDTGANPSVDVKAAVDTIIDDWLVRNGQASIELIAAHSHKHFDHVQGDAQFISQPGVTFVPAGGPEMRAFWGFTNWPHEILQYDLGGRVLDLIPTPGHDSDNLTFYDRRTQLLLTSDIVYPGHIFVFSPQSWPAYQLSLRRLSAFANSRPIEWVLGCHIEFSDQPFQP